MRSKNRLSESSWRHLIPPLSHAASASSLAYGSLHRRKNPIHGHSHQQQHHHHPRAVFGSPRLLNTVYHYPLACHASRRPLWVFSEHQSAGVMNHASWPPASITSGQNRQCQTLLSSSALCLSAVGLFSYDFAP